VYFSAVPSTDWPRGVDAWPSSPQHRASSEAGGDNSDDHNDGDGGERMSHVREKLRGKQPTDEEPSSKRKKTGGSSRREEQLVSIGAPTQHRRRQMVVLSSSNDDGPVAPPSLRVGTPRPAVPAGADMREMPRVRETIAATPDSVRATSAAATHVAP